jgi:hypothetical protein
VPVCLSTGVATRSITILAEPEGAHKFASIRRRSNKSFGFKQLRLMKDVKVVA